MIINSPVVFKIVSSNLIVFDSETSATQKVSVGKPLKCGIFIQRCLAMNVPTWSFVQF